MLILYPCRFTHGELKHDFFFNRVLPWLTNTARWYAKCRQINLFRWVLLCCDLNYPQHDTLKETHGGFLLRVGCGYWHVEGLQPRGILCFFVFWFPVMGMGFCQASCPWATPPHTQSQLCLFQWKSSVSGSTKQLSSTLPLGHCCVSYTSRTVKTGAPRLHVTSSHIWAHECGSKAEVNRWVRCAGWTGLSTCTWYFESIFAFHEFPSLWPQSFAKDCGM